MSTPSNCCSSGTSPTYQPWYTVWNIGALADPLAPFKFRRFFSMNTRCCTQVRLASPLAGHLPTSHFTPTGSSPSQASAVGICTRWERPQRRGISCAPDSPLCVPQPHSGGSGAEGINVLETCRPGGSPCARHKAASPGTCCGGVPHSLVADSARRYHPRACSGVSAKWTRMS
jgi:hypothetical protein